MTTKRKSLSDAQKRVLTLMLDGSPAVMDEKGSCSVKIGGKRVCNVDTIYSLINAGFVEKVAMWTYKATAAGRAWKAPVSENVKA